MMLIDRHGSAAWNMSDALGGKDYVAMLEREVEKTTEKSAVALTSADAALHTALYLCGLKRGDLVFVPTYTFYSNIATIMHAGGSPVFIDSEPITRCMSTDALEAAFLWAELQNRAPRAVVIDNAFGSVADYDRLLPLCKAHGVRTIELSGDALFGKYNGTPCGANCDLGVLNFSKRMDGGGGAIIVGNDERNKTLGFVRKTFDVGENHDYKMHNVIAALDLAKLETAKRVTARSRANLAAIARDCEAVITPVDGDAACFVSVKAKNHAAAIKAAGFTVKSPPPVHTMQQYNTKPLFEHERGFCVADILYKEAILIDLDMSPHSRRRLVRILNALTDGN